MHSDLCKKNVKSLNYIDIAGSLGRNGYAHIPAILSGLECKSIRGLYEDDSLFRSTINMQRYRFGVGEYKYFAYPLPDRIESMRRIFYSQLVAVANEWMEKLGSSMRYPDKFEKFIDLCHDKDQRRPTPLILRYESGGYNTLRQDLYGELHFPFQLVVMLSKPHEDFTGGELVFVDQLPRAQSKASVVIPAQGDAVIFTTNFRPVQGTRGYYKARMKHGVSPVTSGVRYTTGIIFHDAR